MPAHRVLALAGVAGGLLYVAADLLFMATFGAGADFHPLAVMAGRSDAVLVAAGAVAPVASAGYVLGTLAIALRLRANRPRASAAFFVCWAGMFLIGIAYHAVYTTRGFAAKLDAAAAGPTLARIARLLSTLYAGEVALGVAGTLALATAVARGASGYPRWLLLFLPTLWALADALPRALPAPLGGVVTAGWINGCFTAFFVAAWVAARQQGGSGGRAIAVHGLGRARGA